jgi:phosphatidylserine/phosphatidylglycerophosphate/cardiolipin synthase-like enzyme
VTGYRAFEDAAARAVERLGPARLRVLAGRIAAGWPDQEAAHAVPVPGFAETARALLDAQRACDMADAVAAAHLRGLAAGYASGSGRVRVESVWSGPATHGVPVRATAQVLTDLVAEARFELLLMTYSARPYPPVVDALTAASGRGVVIDVVVETLAGAGGALTRAEPATAFQSVPAVRLWQWPPAARAEEGAKMHAKLAVADRAALLVSSANLTQSGVARNLEAGLLVRGGDAPRRAAEHITALMASGALARLRVGG